jgi:hypothetical protein
MTLAEIIKSKGTAGHWSVEVNECPLFADRFECRLYHYGTLMALWRRGPRGGRIEMVSVYPGIGSKSDQDGLNTLFQTLGVADKYYAKRRSGTLIVLDPRKPAERKLMPSYLRDGQLDRFGKFIR